MSNDSVNSLQATSTDWDKAWNVVCRLDVARKHVAGDAEDIAPGLSILPDLDDASGPIEMEAVSPPARRRPLSVWILIGALWISIGLIISATIVALAHLL
jgi:hypothetical protein